MQLEGHGSYWKAKILKIQEFWLLRLLLKKKTFFFTGITPRDPMVFFWLLFYYFYFSEKFYYFDRGECEVTASVVEETDVIVCNALNLEIESASVITNGEEIQGNIACNEEEEKLTLKIGDFLFTLLDLNWILMACIVPSCSRQLGKSLLLDAIWFSKLLFFIHARLLDINICVLTWPILMQTKLWASVQQWWLSTSIRELIMTRCEDFIGQDTLKTEKKGT